MVNAQQWLDENYPKNQRKNITELNIGNKNLTDSLLVSDWSQLEQVSCYSNQLSELKITNCPKLKTIWAYNNQLTDVSINNCPEIKTLEVQNNQLISFGFLNNLKLEKLTWLKFGNNKFPQQDLSFFNQFSGKMVNLWLLGISGSSFTGSLAPLHSFEKLTELEIDGTNLTGLEYLPESCRKIYCDNTPVAESLQGYVNPWNGSYFFQAWHKDNQELIKKAERELSIQSQPIASSSKKSKSAKQKEKLNSSQEQINQLQKELEQERVKNLSLQARINELENQLQILQIQISPKR